jgi:hypothetical protein
MRSFAKREKVTGGWRTLHNVELHNLYSSPSIIRMIKPRRMKWEGHVARMGRRGMHIGYWWESQKEGKVRFCKGRPFVSPDLLFPVFWCSPLFYS